MSIVHFDDIDPALDLVLERVVAVPRELVWRAWTNPADIVHWFTPAPWKTVHCEIDLHPGGKFKTTMHSPEGQEFPNVGCILEVVPNTRLVFTDTLLPGFRPSEKPFFTAIISLETHGSGTRYTAIARHGDAANRIKHEEMGFHGGWSTALDQLVAHTKTM